MTNYDRVNMDNVIKGTYRDPVGIHKPQYESPENYAGFWLRVVAALLDGLILVTPTYIINTILWGYHGLEDCLPISTVRQWNHLVNKLPWVKWYWAYTLLTLMEIDCPLEEPLVERLQ